MRKKLFLVVNPKAGKGRAASVLMGIVNYFSENGYDVQVYPTVKEKSVNLDRIKHGTISSDLITVCGGDGTMNEAITAIMHGKNDIPIGYIPLGSTNDFAVSLDIPLDCSKAVKAIHNGRAFKYDVGRFNKSYFNYIACTGAFTETSYNTSQNLKNVLGHSAYLLNSLKSISTLKKTPMEICLPDETIKGDFLFCSVSNSLSAGGVLRFKKEDVHFNDGKFELLLIKKPKEIFELSSLLVDLTHSEYKNKNIIFKKIENCKINIKNNGGWSLDGEPGGSPENSEICVCRKAVRIIRDNKE